MLITLPELMKNSRSVRVVQKDASNLESISVAAQREQIGRKHRAPNWAFERAGNAKKSVNERRQRVTQVFHGVHAVSAQNGLKMTSEYWELELVRRRQAGFRE